MKIKYVRTNNKEVGIVKQVHTMFGIWRNVEYLNTPIHNIEIKMNKLVVELGKLDAQRDEYLSSVDLADKDIKASGRSLLGTSDPRIEVFGFFKWLKSFSTAVITNKPKKIWVPVVTAVRRNSDVEVKSKRVTVVTTPLAVMNITAAPTPSNTSGKKKGASNSYSK